MENYDYREKVEFNLQSIVAHFCSEWKRNCNSFKNYKNCKSYKSF